MELSAFEKAKAALRRPLRPIDDVLLSPVVFLAALFLRHIRRENYQLMPCCRKAFRIAGIYPIRNHYYEPLFDTRQLRHSLDDERTLPGVDLNVDGQLELLSAFSTGQELQDVPRTKTGNLEFYMENGYFSNGDAEYLYNLIRLKKPARIIEVGCGNSTLMAMRAIRQNRKDDPQYVCEFTCIEPYEVPWLEQTGLNILRIKVEDLDRTFFSALGENDILFIDSSHMIRPQGDIVFEFLEVLPALRKGTIVHIHDIFTPRDYPAEWVVGFQRFWNEQYIFEAFMSCNKEWKIIGAVHYLHRNHFDRLKEKCITIEPQHLPSSIYIQKMA